MKLPLASGVLSSTPPPAPTVYQLIVQRVWDRVEQPRLPDDELPDTTYLVAPHPEEPANHWEVTLDGERVTLVHGDQRLVGRETSNVFNERRFEITEGGLAGVTSCGRFVVRGEDAELTLFGPTDGAGMAVISSERGKLLLWNREESRPAPLP